MWLQYCLGEVNQRLLQAQQVLAEPERKESLELRWKLVWSLDPKAAMLKVGTSFGFILRSRPQQSTTHQISQDVTKAIVD